MFTVDTGVYILPYRSWSQAQRTSQQIWKDRGFGELLQILHLLGVSSAAAITELVSAMTEMLLQTKVRVWQGMHYTMDVEILAIFCGEPEKLLALRIFEQTSWSGIVYGTCFGGIVPILLWRVFFASIRLGVNLESLFCHWKNTRVRLHQLARPIAAVSS